MITAIVVLCMRMQAIHGFLGVSRNREQRTSEESN